MARPGYLFLDIDGVLHRNGSRKKLEFAQNLIPIIEKRSLKVVISSDWRRNIKVSALKQLLGPLGSFVFDVTPDFYTPNLRDGDPPSRRGLRQAEIEFWLSENAIQPFFRFALDDVVTHFEPRCNWLFAVDPEVGLNEQTAIRFDLWIDMEIPRQGSVPLCAIPELMPSERNSFC